MELRIKVQEEVMLHSEALKTGREVQIYRLLLISQRTATQNARGIMKNYMSIKQDKKLKSYRGKRTVYQRDLLILIMAR